MQPLRYAGSPRDHLRRAIPGLIALVVFGYVFTLLWRGPSFPHRAGAVPAAPGRGGVMSVIVEPAPR